MIVGLLIFFAVLALWAVVIRPWLRAKPWMQWFFANTVVEWIEINLWRKSETILVARGLQLVGLIGSASGYLGGIDYSIFVPVVPEKWQPFLPMLPIMFNALGAMMEALRRDTTEPLALVELPKVVPADVANAKEAFETAKIDAVATVDKELSVKMTGPPPPGSA